MQINRRWILLILLLVAVASLYGQFLHNPIVFDDLVFFMLDGDGHSAIQKFSNPSVFDLRALPYATLAWTSQLWGFGLAPLRIENLLMHWLVVVALDLFVLSLYRTVLPGIKCGKNTSMATAVAIAVFLFALHPVAVYAVGYLVQRSTVMATLFGVLCLWTYLKGSTENRKAWLWASVFLYFMATHSKEHIVMLPMVIVAMTVLTHDDWEKQLRSNWPVFASYAAIALLTVAQIKGVLGHPYEIHSGEMLVGDLSEHALFYSILTQCGLFFKYGLLWLLPNPGWMSVDMREPFANGFFSIYGAALIAYCLYGVLAIRLLLKRGSYGLIGFGLLFPWLMFATEFSTVRIQEIFVLYRSYIWALGGVILFPWFLMQLNSRLTILVSVLVAATLFVVSMERLVSFSHPIVLWDDAEKLVRGRTGLPGAGRIYFNRGLEYSKAGMLDRALPDLETATRLMPELSAAFGNLGDVYYRMRQNKLAIQALSRAIMLDQEQKSPPNFKRYYTRAEAYEADGRWREAVADYKVSCFLNGKIGCNKIVPSLKQ